MTDCELCFEPNVSRTLYRGLLICDPCRNSSEQWDCMTPAEQAEAMAAYSETRDDCGTLAKGQMHYCDAHRRVVDRGRA